MTELKQAILLFVTKLDVELVEPEKKVDMKLDRFMMGALNMSCDPAIRYRLKPLQ